MSSGRLIVSTGNPFGLLPFDIVDVTLDIIAAHHLGLRSLKQCALVCKAWLDLCRPRIWAKLSIYACAGCGVATTTLQNRISLSLFSVIIYQREDIGRLIRHIEYHDGILCAHQKHDTPLPLFDALRYISNLSTFSLYALTPLRAARKPQILGFELSYLCARTVTRLDLYVSSDIQFPISLVLHSKGLKKLYIHCLESLAPPNPQSTEVPVRLQEFGFLCNHPQIFGVLTAKRTNGTPRVIDFTVLEKASVAVYDEQKFDIFRPLCEGCRHLVELELTCESSGYQATTSKVLLHSTAYIDSFNGLHELLSPVLHTLQNLTLIHKPSMGLGYEFLGGLAGELQQLKDKNCLQCINIVVELPRFLMFNRFQIGHECLFLDETLTSSGWPELREVAICAKVDCSLDPWNEHKRLVERTQWKSELEVLHFHRLERSDQMKFTYLVT
jgi:hypothetical protein